MYKANRAIIHEGPHARRAVEVYEEGGPDALKAWLRGLVRTWKINPAQATHIYCWTVPEAVLTAEMNQEAKA